ncbi:MAG: YdcF family protein [Candidatus Tectomicrobia bacterium]
MGLLYLYLKALVLPPLNLCVLAAVGWFLGRWWPRLGRTLVAAAVLCLYLLATPYVSSELLRSLQVDPPLTEERLDNDAGAIVVLSGDLYRHAPEYGGDAVGRHTLERLQYGVWLFRKVNLPLLVTGGKMRGADSTLAAIMRQTLRRDFDVPVRWVEAVARNTYENARFSAQLLKRANVRTIYLVTHAWHMRRAKASFQAVGIEVVAAPTRFASKPTPVLGDFLPTARALEASHAAMYEWLGLLWYTWRYY